MHVCPPTWLIQHARMQVLLTDRLRVMYVKAAKIYVERRRRNMASVAVQCEPAEQEHEALLAKVVCVGGLLWKRWSSSVSVRVDACIFQHSCMV